MRCFARLQRKYPDATDYAICSLIGGFFFLRFINPAIVTPQAYMLVDGVPAKFPRRTLTLVRKRFTHPTPNNQGRPSKAYSGRRWKWDGRLRHLDR